MAVRIVWTKVDEAPALASHALLPIVKAFTRGIGVEFEERDISLAGRILAAFPERLPEADRVPDDLAYLGQLTQSPEANIIKLPNISASVPQLKAAIAELQDKGLDVPDYPEEPKTEEEREVRARYAKVLGSAVNPVLREGNSDRRPAPAVKRYARKHPHKMMKPWPKEGSKTRVAHMQEGDFYGSERSITLSAETTARIEFRGEGGETTVLREGLELEAGEVLDTAVMHVAALRRFYAETIEACRQDGTLLSLHLKATMMKVSDPIMFGHCVSVYFADVFEKHGQALEEIGVNPNYGLADLLARLEKLPSEKKAEIERDIEATFERQPPLAMVDSAKGITNLHVPNDVIIDASMPVVIRDGGKMWNRDGELQDTTAMIPDRSYARIYQVVIEDCQAHGQFDPATMGNVSNVGLMAKKAEEYGSHDKTFEAPAAGTIAVVDEKSGETLLEQRVEKGDIFRGCQTKDIAIRDWVKLAVRRARESGTPAIFWLDEKRAHDRELIRKVETYLADHDTSGLDIRVMSPEAAMRATLERVRRGEDTISVTGNVLRDYLTDLFPILELGTSARVLSIVPLLSGGGLYETGAGGSAPKHVRQFLDEGHLRWDSLGEYCALVPSLEQAARQGAPQAKILAAALDRAIEAYLENGRMPSRKVHEPDNRSSTAWLARYWAEALAEQDDDSKLKERFRVGAALFEKEHHTIHAELMAAQGHPVDIGGYYRPDPSKVAAAMRPSPALNAVIEAL